uniref:THAP domain-containing protein 1 n=3 Tax=Gasterosteus aculeatus TaxID=69293 RepID=A0AAQ4QT80_GASAC
MRLYYWVGVTESVKSWIQACSVCRSRTPAEPAAAPVRFCLAYGCDASSYVYPALSFHRFPKEAELRRRWLAAAQRDEGSLRTNSRLCSRHFEPACFSPGEEAGAGGRPALAADAVPTVMLAPLQEDELPVPSDEDLLNSATLEELLHAAAADSADASEPAFDPSGPRAELQEHRYCLPGPDPDSREAQTVVEPNKRKTVIEQSFKAYNQIAGYLGNKVLPVQSKAARGGLKRMAKRFGLKGEFGAQTRLLSSSLSSLKPFSAVSRRRADVHAGLASPQGAAQQGRGRLSSTRTPTSRSVGLGAWNHNDLLSGTSSQVNSILQQFHNNQGHHGHGICQRAITKHFYWASMTRDLARWISSCHTCLTRTKRKWLRCSVSTCTNCCGPVERGLGLTFHKFPLYDPALLARWLKVVGRPNWHPRLGSSVCSTHFTEDCFDRSGEKVSVRPDAVPTLLVHGGGATPAEGPTPPVGEEAYFAKYDAVELYLSRRTYPPGLSYVEKNTFRRFCKQFSIKDDALHIARGDRVRLVLRSRQQVEAALTDYHNELNHLDLDKCLRLLNERYFWKTMRSDVLQWINSCSQCSRRKRPAHQSGPRKRLEAMTSPATPDHVDSEDDEGGAAEADEGGCDEEQQPRPTPLGGFSAADEQEDASPPQPAAPITPQPRIPILLHLRTPIGFQPRMPIVLRKGTPDGPFVARLLPVETATPPQRKTKETSFGKDQDQTRPPAGSRPPPERPAQHGLPQAASEQKRPMTLCIQRRVKKQRDPQAASPAKRRSCGGLEPVVAPSTKPWPVFTIAGSAPVRLAESLPEVGSTVPLVRPGGLQARTVIQQCTAARVKIRPALDGAAAQWAEIQEGMVVYVCFLHGATEDVAHQMAGSLMTTRLFRKDSGHSVSVLDLPGSVLLVPQDSLLGEPLPRRRVQYRGGCELWRGAQLFSSLVAACRDLMDGSAKCAKAGVAVEQGVYGQRQEMVLSAAEPMTLLLEF